MKKLIFLILFVILIFDVSAISIDINVPEKYHEVLAGERFYFEIAVKYPENPTRIDLRLEYEIKDSQGKVVAESKALKAVETQASFIDYVILPTDVKKGMYTIHVYVKDYGNLSEEVSSSFYVTTSQIKKLMNYIYALSGGIIFLTALIIVDFTRKRKK